MKLNLVFHRILKDKSQVDDIYNCSEDYFNKFIDTFIDEFYSGSFEFNDFQLYFDDGDRSFLEIVYPKMPKYLKARTSLAIVTDWIDKKGFMTKQELNSLKSDEINICAHSVSHPALAVFDQGKLLKSPYGGKYQSAPFGQGNALYQEEIKFQLNESKKTLEDLLGLEITEFVFPHGLYNSNIVTMNYQYNLYRYLSTCEEYLDEGQLIKPRLLVESDKSIDSIMKKIQDLKPFTPDKLLTQYEE